MASAEPSISGHSLTVNLIRLGYGQVHVRIEEIRRLYRNQLGRSISSQRIGTYLNSITLQPETVDRLAQALGVDATELIRGRRPDEPIGSAISRNLIHLGYGEIRVQVGRIAHLSRDRSIPPLTRQRISAILRAPRVRLTTVNRLAEILGIDPTELARPNSVALPDRANRACTEEPAQL